MKKQNDVFEKYSVPRALMVMAIPTIISQLIILVYNMADTWFIGRTNDPVKVAACSLVLTIYLFAIILSNIFGVGGGTLISRLMGRHEEAEASRVSAVCIYMAFFAGVIYALLAFVFMTPLLRLLGASDQVLVYAKQYLFFVIVIGGLPAVMSQTFAALLRSVGYSSQASFGLSMGGVLNIILDPLFMFVILPSGYEVAGAAIATMLSNVTTTIYFLYIYAKAKHHSVLRFTCDALPGATSFRAIFGVGIPAGFSLFLFDFANIIINRLASHHGDIELAAIGIVLKVERLPLNVGVGICLGMVPLLAYSYSAKQHERMDAIFRTARLFGLCFAFVCVFLYYIFAPVIIRFFIGDAETVRYGTMFLRARCFATPLMFLCFSMVHFVQAIGRGRAALALAVIRQCCCNIPLLLLLNHLFGMQGIVWTQLIADVITVIASYIIYFGIRKSEHWEIRF